MLTTTHLEDYLVGRRDVLSRFAKSFGDNEKLLKVAIHAAAGLLFDRGNTLTLTARIIGQSLDKELTDKAQIKLGGRFLNLLHTLKLIQLDQLSDDSWQVSAATEEFNEYCHSIARKKRVANITEKPEDWHKPFNRGVPIVKKLASDEQHYYTIEQMPKVYKALNALQNTKWTVNDRILELMENGYEFSPFAITPAEAAVARKELITEKRKSLSFEEWSFMKNSERYSKAAATKFARLNATSRFKLHSKDARSVVAEFSVMEAFVKTTQLAQEVRYEDLYFQYNLDSRGRLYALSGNLSPQGPDYQKALLRFASSGPINAFWVKVHIANCAGKDKLSFIDRVQWVDDNIDGIEAVGINPRSPEALQWIQDNRIQKESKTRWQFVASAMEWIELQLYGTWTIPVGVDATSQGLQFLSAIARDESIAEDVNISPCSYAPVGDLYQKVGDAVIQNIDFEKAPSLAHLSVGDKTLRKVVKRSCMTFAYSCQGGSMGDHTYDDRGTYEDEILKEMTFSECAYIGQVEYDTIKQMLPRAAAVMEAMQNCFTGYKGSRQVSWVGPVGFRAVQDKPAMKNDRLLLEFDNRKPIKVVVYSATEKASVREHKMAISPNAIHHLDAAMMIETVCSMVDAGITSFHVVHDCYGTNSGDIDILNHHARQAFYNIVVSDPVQQIMDQAVPGTYEAPAKGNWSPSDVLISKYFLC